MLTSSRLLQVRPETCHEIAKEGFMAWLVKKLKVNNNYLALALPNESLVMLFESCTK